MKMAQNTKRAPFITRIDIFVFVAVIILLSSIGVVVKLVLQKDTFVTVELLASGGEWWWGVPPPYYWNARDVAAGSIEYDALNKPAVEILDVVKYGEDDRRFMWMKVRLRAKRNYLTKQFVFRQESLQIGKVLHIAPNNVALVGQIVGIDGVGTMWNTEYVEVTGKAIHIHPWEADIIQVGDKITDNNGDLVVEITDKKAELSDVMTTTWQGETLSRKNPLLRDVTLTMKMRVMKDGHARYFNYYQPVGVGNKTRIQFAGTAVEINIMSVSPVR